MSRPLIAISVGDAPEQLSLGYGREHLAEALVRLGRLLLRQGCDLAYGGDLRSGGFTELLLQVVRAEGVDGAVNAQPPRSSELRRLVNFLPWPGHLALTADPKARYLGICRFVCVDPPAPLLVRPVVGTTDAESELLGAPLALSRMRQAMAAGGVDDTDGRSVPAAAARIVLGGKLDGFSGLMPGILEEVACTLLSGERPVFVLGGFGGAAAALAQSVLDKELLPELTIDAQRQSDPKLAGVLAVLEREPFAARFAALHPRRCESALMAFCKAGVQGLAARSELSVAQVEVLLRSRDFDVVRAVLATVRWGELGGVRGGGSLKRGPAKASVAAGQRKAASAKSRRRK